MGNTCSNRKELRRIIFCERIDDINPQSVSDAEVPQTDWLLVNQHILECTICLEDESNCSIYSQRCNTCKGTYIICRECYKNWKKEKGNTAICLLCRRKS